MTILPTDRSVSSISNPSPVDPSSQLSAGDSKRSTPSFADGWHSARDDIPKQNGFVELRVWGKPEIRYGYFSGQTFSRFDNGAPIKTEDIICWKPYDMPPDSVA